MLQINNKKVPQKHYAQVQTIHRFICTKNTVSFFFLCSQTDFSGKIADDYIEHLQNLECKLSVFSVCVSMWLFQAQSAKDSVPLRKAPGIPVNKDKPVRKFGKRVREKFASHRTLI